MARIQRAFSGMSNITPVPSTIFALSKHKQNKRADLHILAQTVFCDQKELAMPLGEGRNCSLRKTRPKLPGVQRALWASANTFITGSSKQKW